jgi:hypothetical protein
MLGDSQVRVYWNAEPDGRLTGSFYHLKSWSPVLLDGARGPNCGFRIAEGPVTTSDASSSVVFWEGDASELVEEDATTRIVRSAKPIPTEKK